MDKVDISGPCRENENGINNNQARPIGTIPGKKFLVEEKSDSGEVWVAGTINDSWIHRENKN